MIQRPTDCVTCAGAGTAKPSNQKKAQAYETAWDLRRIPSVRCTLCWATCLLTKTLAKKDNIANTPNFYT